MQALQGNFSYLLNSRLGSSGVLENDRQHLVQQQKLCRARARKFLLETNRRRKALDERRRQWDIQEQRLRENILQQRRQQVQDATQRFQRAHLPPSQRYRQTVRKNAANIEEALSQIQGSFSWCTQNSSVLSSTNTRSCPLSTKPPTDSKSSHCQALSAVEAYAKLLQEQCTIDEEQQDHSSEESQLSDSCVSESLSSKDSLENEGSNQSTLSPESSYSSFFLDIEKLGKRDDLRPASDPTSVSAMMFLDQIPSQLKQEQQEDSNWTNNDRVVPKTSRLTPERQTPTIDNPLTLKGCDLLKSLSRPFNGDAKHFHAKYFINSDNLLVRNEAEPLYPREETLLDSGSQMIHDCSQLNYPSAQCVPSSSENDIRFQTPMKRSTANNHPKDVACLHTEKETFRLSPENDTFAPINNLNKVSNLMCKMGKPINTAPPSHISLSNIQSERVKCDGPKEEDKRIPISLASSHSVCDVRFLKGILKTRSKYTSEDLCLCDSERLMLAKHVAIAIKDSIELTRAKTKDVAVGNAMKKKLRWFDEVRPEKEAKEQYTAKPDKDVSYSLSRPTNSPKDHRPSLTVEAGPSKPGPRMTPVGPAGYHFTKEAWTDVGVQVNLPQEPADEVKAPRTSARTAGPRVPRRNRNARAVGGPVSSRTRKGTVMRPQSATDVSQIVKTQGKIMVPRPPPRTEPTEENTACVSKTPYGSSHPSMNYRQALITEEAPCKNHCVELFSPNKHHPVAADSTAMYRTAQHPSPCPAYPFSDSNLKGTASSEHPETQNNNDNNDSRGTVNEKGLNLHSTPTDEEILQLWHGVRSALHTKDAKPALKKPALESRRVCRKSSAEQSREPPGSGGSRRLLHSSQVTNQNTELIRPGPVTCNTVSQNEGCESAALLHTAEVHPGGFVWPNQTAANTEKAQTPERLQQGLTNLSLEEKKIMLSLDRLNHQLYCFRELQGDRTGNNGHPFNGTPFTKEGKVSNNDKRRGSSANQLHFQKKI